MDELSPKQKKVTTTAPLRRSVFRPVALVSRRFFVLAKFIPVIVSLAGCREVLQSRFCLLMWDLNSALLLMVSRRARLGSRGPTVHA